MQLQNNKYSSTRIFFWAFKNTNCVSMHKNAYNMYAHFKLKYFKNFKIYGNGG